MSSDVVFAYCTFPSEDVAHRICERLVLSGTIACANILSPHRALYLWKGQLQKEKEWAALLKLPARKKTELKERIRAEHPYDVPALAFLKIDDGLPEFLNWIYYQSV
ncbi:MAG: divalent-cation tolerance protein CutA [Bdellovibrionales bacterium]